MKEFRFINKTNISKKKWPTCPYSTGIIEKGFGRILCDVIIKNEWQKQNKTEKLSF